MNVISRENVLVFKNFIQELNLIIKCIGPGSLLSSGGDCSCDTSKDGVKESPDSTDTFCDCEDGWIRAFQQSGFGDFITTQYDFCIPCFGPWAYLDASGVNPTCACDRSGDAKSGSDIKSHASLYQKM